MQYRERARRWLGVGLVVAVPSLVGCRIEHEVKPTHHTVKIEPIHMTLDVNLRVQKELDEFYEDVEGEKPEAEPKQGEEP